MFERKVILLKNKEVIWVGGAKKGGTPRNEGTTRDVYENKGREKAQRWYPKMLLKTGELFCLTRDV
jgi:hypothetical protein